MAAESDIDVEGSGRVCVGAVSGARGLKGEVRVKSFTAEPTDIAAYGPLLDDSGERSFTLRVVGQAKGQVIARIDGIGDRTQAEGLKGVKLYVAKDALPTPADDEFYHADLQGLRAELTDGAELGTVKAVHDFGAGPILEIEGSEHKGLMVPFSRAAVPVVDLEGGRVVIDPPPGLLEPPEEEAKAS